MDYVQTEVMKCVCLVDRSDWCLVAGGVRDLSKETIRQFLVSGKTTMPAQQSG
jgi:hypothetical protein